MVLQKLGQLEAFSEQELRAQGSHYIAKGDVIQDAKKRLEQLKLDDVDELYSLRLSGANRVFSIRRNNVMCLLWWDPEHEICPSAKRNT